MNPLVASLPLLGIVLSLLAYWLWKRAEEAATDADLQKRFWDQSKYQREYSDRATPLEAAEWFAKEKTKYMRLALVFALAALLCFGYGVYALLQGQG